MPVQLADQLSPSDRFESSRSACQSPTRAPQMAIHPTGPTLPAILQTTLNQLQLSLRNLADCRRISLADPSNPSPILSGPPPFSLTVLLVDRLCAGHLSTSRSILSPSLSSTSDPSLFLSLQPFIMIPQPNRDQALLRSFLGNLARSCYWSSFIRPLVFLILTYQLRHHYPTAQSSAKKLLDQLQLPHPPIPPPKLALRLSAPRVPKRIRAARALRCSTLVENDSSILHQHQPASVHLSRSSAYRTIPRSAVFIRPSRQVTSPFELQHLSALALSQMERSPYCPSEDSLDGDQRHQRYYLVNAYRAKISTAPADLQQQNSPTWQQSDLDGGEGDDDDAGLEPLEDLLDWDSSTRPN